MRNPTAFLARRVAAGLGLAAALLTTTLAQAQTVAFPGAGGFGRFATGARGVATRDVYVVTNLNDSGPGSFRDAVSQPGRVVTFAVGGIINLQSNVQVAPNVTIAGQTAPGDGIVLFNKRVTFTGASNSICRFLRIRLGATGNQGNDASGLSQGANIIFDHMSFSWGMDEVFSISWDGKGTAPDNITVQNSIIGQGLHRANHSAGGLIQTPDGGKVSLLGNLYISNKTRNPKVKGVNEFVNNVVYDWGNGNRLGEQLNYGWSGDAYIMGGSSGVSEVNIINNYFVGGPLTPPSKTTPFSRGTGTFNLYGAGNYFDNNRNGVLDGTLVPYDTVGYPGIVGAGFRSQPFAYPAASPVLTAQQAYQHVIDSVGAAYPRRDQVDGLMIDEVRSRGTQGYYVYNETDLPFSNGGLGNVFGAPAPADADQDGMPDAWEDAHGLNKNSRADAVAFSAAYPAYLNIEVYINSLIKTPAPAFVKPPTDLQLAATSVELPAPASQVVLSWTDNATGETHFVLERSADGVTYSAIAQPGADAVSYTDNAGLQPNQTYYYRLRAVTATEESGFALGSVKTPALPSAPGVAASPTPTNGQQYADLVAGGLTLKWTGSTNTVSYSVYLGTSPTTLSKVADVPYSATPTYQAAGLTENVTYYWRIDAVNAKGTADGPVWSFRTTGAVVPQLVGHWGFDETAADGLQILDQSSYANHGVLGLDDDDQSIRVAGKVNGALSFASARTDMYVVSIPHQDQLYLDRSSFSLAFWMKADPTLLPSGTTASAYLLCKGSFTRNAATGATGRRFDIEFKSRQLRFAIDDDVNKDELQTDGTPFFTGNWVHVVAMRDVPNKKLLLYLNGTLIKEITTKANGIGEVSDLVVGNIGELEFLSSANAPAPYKGALDELKVFNYLLTPQQIVELRHSGPLPMQAYDPSIASNTVLEGYGDVSLGWKGGFQSTGYKLYAGSSATSLAYVADVTLADAAYRLPSLTPNATYFWRVDAVSSLGTTTGETWSFRTGNPRGLVAHFKLDEPSGIRATDHSAYQHHATLSGLTGSQWQPGAGKFGGSLLFGTPVPTGSLTVPDASQLRFDQNSFSMSMWVKMPTNTYTFSTGKDAYLIHKGTFEPGTGKWYGMQLRDGVLTFSIDDGTTKTDAAVRVNTAPYNLFNGQWQHIVAVRDVNAKLMKLYLNGTLVVSRAYTTGTIGKGDPLTIGNSAENKPFRDLLDDVRLFNYALSGPEITDLAKQEQTIRFAALPTSTLGDADFALTATASSGLAVSYASADTTVARVLNGQVQLRGAGTTVITASQPGDANYLAAAPVAQRLTVLKRSQTITFAALPAQLLGDADLALSATASSGLPVVFISSDPTVALVVDGTVQLLRAGTVTISATQAGDATYLAAPAVMQELVINPVQVVVRHQDGDNGRLTNNVIRPNLLLVNEGPVAVPYAELTARYWLTAENDAGLNGFVDNAQQLGRSRVQLRYVRLPQPRNGAYGYVEYSFDPATGSLPVGGTSGEIKTRLANHDWADLNEADDHSYRSSSAYLANNHLTLYRNGRLVWGEEPAVVPAVLALKVLASNRNHNTGSNTISNHLSVQNEGNQPLRYEDLTVRYWFSAEGSAGLNYWVDYARLGRANVTGQFTRLEPARAGADAYLELNFAPGLGTLYPLSGTGGIQYRIAKADWSGFLESNDFSYQPAGPLAENDHITVYYQGQLIYGTEPAAASARQMAGSTSARPMRVAVLGNPVVGEQAEVEVRGVAGQSLTLEVLDLQGNPVSTQQVTQAAPVQHATIPLRGVRAGVYLLKVTSAEQTTVVRLLKP
ncbi:T9SS type A sorting domain-containing protein [Hymenobacter sp. BT175]|uniref:LamG-like jellyroll fold domain-containing protein n=1 Tax=Hymenobacter translucens TaxID=2886507 RepID=UPI001D0E31C8|nr:LamG-like jellyroll fold domain-containing protein [Hymenobacter translucens]MCC2546589.1 T9SS type A sorting domain-containing protein [Hymenobacter translucens]